MEGNNRQCFRCERVISPNDGYEYPTGFTQIEHVASWLAGFCSPVCMQENARERLKVGEVWWRKLRGADNDEGVRASAPFEPNYAIDIACKGQATRTVLVQKRFVSLYNEAGATVATVIGGKFDFDMQALGVAAGETAHAFVRPYTP